MSEYIHKQKLLDKVKEHQDNVFGIPLIIAEIENAETVEVVRCKGCKHWLNVGYNPLLERGFGYCSNTETPFQCENRPCTSENDFCSYGERKSK